MTSQLSSLDAMMIKHLFLFTNSFFKKSEINRVLLYINFFRIVNVCVVALIILIALALISKFLYMMKSVQSNHARVLSHV